MQKPPSSGIGPSFKLLPHKITMKLNSDPNYHLSVQAFLLNLDKLNNDNRHSKYIRSICKYHFLKSVLTILTKTDFANVIFVFIVQLLLRISTFWGLLCKSFITCRTRRCLWFSSLYPTYYTVKLHDTCIFIGIHPNF